MKKALYLASLLLALVAMSAEWHYPLYLDCGKPHRQRRKIEITNIVQQDIDGEMLFLPVGELGLAGKEVRELRLVDADEHELMYAVHPEAKVLTADSQLVVPVKAAAGESTFVWLYWGNPDCWELPDLFKPPLQHFEDSFENGSGAVPDGWRSAMTDDYHITGWSDTVARTGKRSVMTKVLPGASPTWVQHGRSFTILPGSKYIVRGWVKGENIQGHVGAGFYLHIGPAGNVGRNPLNIWNNHGTFDWRKIEFTGTVPEDANAMTFGTVLSANSGTAWFDDIEMFFESKGRFEYKLGAVETLDIASPAYPPAWELPPEQWPDRYCFAAYNLGDEPLSGRLCAFPVGRVTHANYPAECMKLMIDGRPVPILLFSGYLLFQLPTLAPRSAKPAVLYIAAQRHNQVAGIQVKQASAILSDLEAAGIGTVEREAYSQFLNSPANMAKDASFENNDGTWRPGVNDKGCRIVTGGLFGKNMGVVELDKGQKGWHGLYQAIPARMGKTYLYAGWVNSPGLTTVWGHEFTKGSPSPYQNIHITVPGNGWRPFAGYVTAKHPDSIMELHLSTESAQTHAYDGILLAEMLPVSNAMYEGYEDKTADSPLRVAQVDTIVKVFPDTPVAGVARELSMSMARNETEGLQLAVRSSRGYKNLQVEITEPVSVGGKTLPKPEISLVGNVKVDSESRYNSFTEISVYGLCVPYECWPENYPDPLYPAAECELKRNVSLGVYFRMHAPRDAEAGWYQGKVVFKDGARTLLEIPYKVHVWAFSLPERPEITAIFDNRHGKGVEHKTYEAMDSARFLARNRLSLDEIPTRPQFRLVKGKVTADFTEFDKLAKIWFDEWNIPLAYLPLFREHFGWGHPPKPFLGVNPYPGKHPYEGVDRGKFTDEYKRVCQEALKLMMSHLKEKGWEDRFLLYVADEPHQNTPGVKEQMIALCDMFHEAWPTVKIYSSTWHYVKEWVGKLDVWGIGVQGQVSAEEFKILREAGAEFLVTTDGQMCVDTPYNAIERLLPLYCWKHGLKGYEYWGCDWYTHNPYEWGIHTVHFESNRPGNTFRVRYPNADGYIFYPGNLIGVKGPASSVRAEALRDGVEDYSYYALLDKLVRKHDDAEGRKLLDRVGSMVSIPNAGGRKSEYLLPEPVKLSALRLLIGEAIERLEKNK